MLRFLSAIRHDCPRYTHAFTEKAQHLWRWISLRMLTQGRLVPRQPWAIKSTTRTELRDENIRGDRCVHWNIGTTPTALHRYNIQNCEYIHYNTGIKYTALRRYHIHHVGYIIGIPTQHLWLCLLATLSISAVFIWKTWISLLMYLLLSRNSLYQPIFTLGRLHIIRSLLNKK